MKHLSLKVITPHRVVQEKKVSSLTAPSREGEITILPRHSNLFSLLEEGIVRYVDTKNEEDFLAIGGGYLETDGKQLTILVSRAYGQDQIDEEFTKKAIEQAEQTLRENKDTVSLHEAQSLLRRSRIDMKLIRRKRRAG